MQQLQQLGRYEIIAELGRGAMGTVYQARDPRIDRLVALKTISITGATPSEEEEYRRRFYREAQAAGKLAHPGIVTIFDVGEDPASQTPFIVMEYIAGTTLESIAQVQRPAVNTTLELVRQIAEALHYAHAQGIIHRDIKPANIIVTNDGHAKITDFGVAKLAVADFTVAGQVLGTPTFMAPEQLSGHPVDGRADLFSLGIIFYILLGGVKPFIGGTLSEVMFKVVNNEPAPVTQLNSNLSEDFDYAIGRALAKFPANRYQSGHEFACDMEDLLAGLSPRSRYSSPTTSVWGETTIAKVVQDQSASAAQAAAAPGAARAHQSGTMMASGSNHAASALPIETDAPPLERTSLFQRIPLRIRFEILGVLLLCAAFAAIEVWLHSSAPSETQAINSTSAHPTHTPAPRPTPPAEMANLLVKVVHTFHSAEMVIWVDGHEVDTARLSGGGVFRKKRGARPITVSGHYENSIPVTAGNHIIRVRVSSKGYRKTKQIQGGFAPKGEDILVIHPSHELRLEWQ